MRALLTAVIVMGVLIVAMTATLAVVIVRRLAVAPTLLAQAMKEAPGTHMQAIAPAGDRLAVLLQGGGADRIVLLDPRSGQVVGRIGLAQ